MKNKYQNIRIKKTLTNLVNSIDNNSYLYGVIEGILLTYNFNDFDKYQYQKINNTKTYFGIQISKLSTEQHNQYLIRKAKELICHLDYLEK